MKKTILALLFLTSVLYHSCSEDNPTNYSTIEKNFTPHNVGAIWKYSYINANDTTKYSEEVIAEEDNGYYKIRQVYSHNGVPIIDTFYWKITDEGLMIYDIGKTFGGYLLKKPYQKGTTWIIPVTDSTQYNCSIVADNFTYSTPAGSFTGCLEVLVFFYGFGLYEYIYAPQVGCIKHLDYVLQTYYIP